jgi:hypothetical protein
MTLGPPASCRQRPRCVSSDRVFSLFWRSHRRQEVAGKDAATRHGAQQTPFASLDAIALGQIMAGAEQLYIGRR